MTRWTAALLRRLAPPDRVEDLLGDLEEVARRRAHERGRVIAGLLTLFEALATAAVLLRARVGARRQERQPGSSDRRRGRFPAFSWLDFKLGFRMLVRYPGLSVVSTLAMAFAIWLGAGTFEFLGQLVFPALPLDDGHRVVAIQSWNASTNRVERRVLHDYVTWRDQLQTIEDLGAFRTVERNMITGVGQGEPVSVAETSASAFPLTRIPPLLGRALIAADEQPGAPEVAVIGYELWQRRLEGDPAIVGKSIRLGNSLTTVVGVMPPGFAFPVAHELWVPLRVNPLDHERAGGPSLQVFGRLVPGASLEDAQTELTAFALRARADFPRTHEHLRFQVMPYARSIINIPGWFSIGLMGSNTFIVMLLVLICGNVALLLFARAATRESEIIVRNALGASRGRIISQLFVEALVLGAVAALIGLAAAGAGLRWGMAVVEAEVLEGGRLPFWFSGALSPATILYAVLLTLLAAVVSGVLPALRITRSIGTQLRQTTAGAGGVRFGGVWTALIVVQVAVTVTAPAIAFFVRRDAVQIASLDVGFPNEEYLAVRIEMERSDSRAFLDNVLDGPAVASTDGRTEQSRFLAGYQASLRELERRVEAHPSVRGVTRADVLPQMYHGWSQIEVDVGALPTADPRGHRVSSAMIDADYFEVLRTPIVSGRPFHPTDVETGASVVLVNTPFVANVLGGQNPIGRHIRYIDGEAGRELEVWHEIIGVVGDIGMTSGYGRAGIYHPIPKSGTHPLYMAIHTSGPPQAFASTLRTLATATDPTLRLHDLMPMDDVINAELQFTGFWFWLTVLVSSVALLLSLAGIYAVMSFTVSRRTREIGIRVALGAEPLRVTLTIFRRPLLQVSLGVLSGTLLTGALASGIMRGALWPRGVALVAVYALLMLGVCLLACIVPTRRALRIEPSDALRQE